MQWHKYENMQSRHRKKARLRFELYGATADPWACAKLIKIPVIKHYKQITPCYKRLAASLSHQWNHISYKLCFSRGGIEVRGRAVCLWLCRGNSGTSSCWVRGHSQVGDWSAGLTPQPLFVWRASVPKRYIYPLWKERVIKCWSFSYSQMTVSLHGSGVID